MRTLSLDTLPVELLYEIQKYALSPYLPHVSRHLYAVYKSAPTSVQAQYLIGRFLRESEYSPRQSIITVVLRYPVCSQGVLEAILRSPECPSVSRTGRKTELPRRLFRALSPRDSARCSGQRKPEDKTSGGWTEDDDPLPFLRYLYDNPGIPPPYTNSYDGYALTKAVHVGFIHLVRFLLEHDASPACKDGLAVMVAIRRKDIDLVRMLIEPVDRQFFKRGGAEVQEEPGGDQNALGTVKRGTTYEKSSGDVRSAKRRKLEDRVQVNREMLKMAVKCDARNIVEYLVKEKGCIPDMQTVLLMGRPEGA